MTALSAPTDLVVPGELTLVCAPHAWAWGWPEDSSRDWVELAWPEGEPPLDFPSHLFEPVLKTARSASVDQQVRVRLCCTTWAAGSAPEWWPTRTVNLGLWRESLFRMGLHLSRVEQTAERAADGELRDWMGGCRWKRVWPRSGAWAWLGSDGTPGQRVLASGVAALGLHGVLTLWAEPAWDSHRTRWREQQALDRQAEIEQAAQAKLQAQAQAHQSQRLRWSQAQQNALLPLQELTQLLEQVGPTGIQQLWVALRRFEGSWTILGLSSRDAYLSEVVRHASTQTAWALTPSEPVVWPPEPEMGWPARRFQLQASFASPAPNQSGP